ncbi:hypothetical protein [Agrilutibacter solisilvae]|uniref:Uncharacterized protein n=1 Tax=Agrilutibacter solisilvae TaxID=2763317 RepID=A0A974Y1R9_9GAMM|nr:hypothetical protein [Lysobacter solisilvae]QSX79812.1 hypothetical protein I8J32_008275 [Lysobacter solisilvae]
MNLMTCGVRGFGLAVVLAAIGCQSASGARAPLGAAQFRCGPTDDVELVVSVATPPDDQVAQSRLVAVIGSEHWRALERGERRLELSDAAASQWCSGAQAACEAPAGLVFEVSQSDLRDGGVLEGAVEVRLADQRTVHLPFRAPVARQQARCG